MSGRTAAGCGFAIDAVEGDTYTKRAQKGLAGRAIAGSSRDAANSRNVRETR